MEKVIVAFESSANSVKVKDILELDGGLRCLICRSGAEVKRAVCKRHLRVVVCGLKLPDESCQTLFHDLPEGCFMLMVGPQDRLELCQTDGIFKLFSPVRRSDLLDSVQMLLQLGERGVRQREPVKRSREELKLVAQAKEVLMERHGMTEEQAHRFLQRQSMNRGAKLADTARIVLGDE